MTHHAKHFSICTVDTRECAGETPDHAVDIDFTEMGTGWRLRCNQLPVETLGPMNVKTGLSWLDAIDYALMMRKQSEDLASLYVSEVERLTHLQWLDYVTRLLHREAFMIQSQVDGLRNSKSILQSSPNSVCRDERATARVNSNH